ncbi:hypothetical protein [Desulfosediminicola sp.]|uniref:hypothetical protein n=1 Tax=Desulfosediminicola sp. TaxID=2886825 RepID=UPI003AF254C9
MAEILKKMVPHGTTCDEHFADIKNDNNGINALELNRFFLILDKILMRNSV